MTSPPKHSVNETFAILDQSILLMIGGSRHWRNKKDDAASTTSNHWRNRRSLERNMQLRFCQFFHTVFNLGCFELYDLFSLQIWRTWIDHFWYSTVDARMAAMQTKAVMPFEYIVMLCSVNSDKRTLPWTDRASRDILAALQAANLMSTFRINAIDRVRKANDALLRKNKKTTNGEQKRKNWFHGPLERRSCLPRRATIPIRHPFLN